MFKLEFNYFKVNLSNKSQLKIYKYHTYILTKYVLLSGNSIKTTSYYKIWFPFKFKEIVINF